MLRGFWEELMIQEDSVVGGSGQVSCWKQVIESKWIDAALVVGGVALLVIAVLASVGVLNSMGANTATHLSYVMYIGGVAFLLIEFVKIISNQGGSKSTVSTNSGMVAEGVNIADLTPQEYNDNQKRKINILFASVAYSSEYCASSGFYSLPPGWHITVVIGWYLISPKLAQKVSEEGGDNVRDTINGIIDINTARSQYVWVDAPNEYNRAENNGEILVALCAIDPSKIEVEGPLLPDPPK